MAEVNKVVYGNETLMDLTGDTVTEESLRMGETAHDKSGRSITGTWDPNAVKEITKAEYEANKEYYDNCEYLVYIVDEDYILSADLVEYNGSNAKAALDSNNTKLAELDPKVSQLSETIVNNQSAGYLGGTIIPIDKDSSQVRNNVTLNTYTDGMISVVGTCSSTGSRAIVDGKFSNNSATHEQSLVYQLEKGTYTLTCIPVENNGGDTTDAFIGINNGSNYLARITYGESASFTLTEDAICSLAIIMTSNRVYNFKFYIMLTKGTMIPTVYQYSKSNVELTKDVTLLSDEIAELKINEQKQLLNITSIAPTTSYNLSESASNFKYLVVTSERGGSLIINMDIYKKFSIGNEVTLTCIGGTSTMESIQCKLMPDMLQFRVTNFFLNGWTNTSLKVVGIR